MNRLDTEHVLILYALVSKATAGGSRGLRDMEALHSVVDLQNKNGSTAKGKKAIYKIAAEVMNQIIDKRPFADGNKRTAMLASLTLLSINGYELQVRKGDIEDYAMCVANEKPSVKEIATWLKRHSVSN